MSQIDEIMYELLSLHSLRGSSGFTPFIGIVFNGTSGIAQGYLCSVPVYRQLLAVLRKAAQLKNPIGRERGEKWCRQLVEAVSEAHTKGITIGILGEEVRDGVGLDEFDNVILYRPKTTFNYNSSRVYLLPPEDKPFATTEIVFPARFETDIYQLGLYLWNIWKLIYPCSVQPGTISRSTNNGEASYVKELLSQGSQVPQYLYEIIIACGTENPHKRPSALKLLSLIPRDDGDIFKKGGCEQLVSSSISLDKSQVHKPLENLEQIYEKNKATVICDRCREETSKHHFTCDGCHKGDFDLCMSCFSKTYHCENTQHLLSEGKQHELGRRRSGLYYSVVKESGQRDELRL